MISLSRPAVARQQFAQVTLSDQLRRANLQRGYRRVSANGCAVRRDGTTVTACTAIGDPLISIGDSVDLR